MNTHEPKYDLFSPSGCLSRQGIRKSISGSLNREEREKTDDHLAQCDLCAEAVEGFSQIDEEIEFDTITNELDKKLNQRVLIPRKFSGDRVFYYSAAASITILIGLLFFLSNTSNKGVFGGDIAHEIQIPDQVIPSMPLAQNTEELNSILFAEDSKENKDSPGISKNKTEIKQGQNYPNRISETRITQERVSDRLKSDKKGLEAFLNEDNQKSITETTKISAVYVDIASNQAIEYYLGEIIIDNANPASNLDLTPFEKIRHNPILPRNEFNNNRENTNEEVASTLSSHFFNPLETMPEFPGGFEGLNGYLSKNLSYPKWAHDKKIQGRVIVSFLIDKDGSVKNVMVLQGIDKECDEEAIRVIRSMPSWKPALQNGRGVGVMFTLPIHFRIL